MSPHLQSLPWIIKLIKYSSFAGSCYLCCIRGHDTRESHKCKSSNILLFLPLGFHHVNRTILFLQLSKNYLSSVVYDGDAKLGHDTHDHAYSV